MLLLIYIDERSRRRNNNFSPIRDTLYWKTILVQLSSLYFLSPCMIFMHRLMQAPLCHASFNIWKAYFYMYYTVLRPLSIEARPMPMPCTVRPTLRGLAHCARFGSLCAVRPTVNILRDEFSWLGASVAHSQLISNQLFQAWLQGFMWVILEKFVEMRRLSFWIFIWRLSSTL